MRFVVFAFLLLVRPTPSEACSKRHQTPFELFDRAETVALVNVRKTPSNSPKRIVAGDVELSVTRVLKGAKTKLIIAKESETECRASYVLGTDALVLLGANGFTVGAHDGHLREPAAWAPVLDQWAQATDSAARVAVVVDAITSKHRGVTEEAMMFLLDEPALLEAVTAEQTQRIAKAAKAMPRDWAITLLLARLRDPSAPSKANVAAWAKATRAFLAVKQTETDVQKLAAIIEKPTRDADPRRAAALDRCERVHGVSLFAFINYVSGTGSEATWRALADACRTGKPLRD
ncbi:MAG: hypothetical protein M4D80_26725 [Myxococcota bacterium]|nr:hypothetical protein [Deltaproteobacteria bacterium]MDQ3338777.1 hypothetical protein [Myxococcota bacterium]